MQSLLLHIHRDRGQEARFQAAVDVARAFNGHITCLQATPFESYVIGDPFGGIYALPQMIAQIREEEEAERSAIEDRLRGEGVSWDWLAYDGSAAKMLVDRSRLADLIVVSPDARDEDAKNQPPPVAADVALHARTPVLVVPPESRGLNCSGTAVVAWNGSFEASHALRFALPLLRLASSVTIVTAVEEGDTAFPATEACEYLSRHGIGSELVERPRDGQPIATILTNAVASIGGDYLVMGAYGHSRVRERILGGVTRGMLDEPTVPLLLAH